MHAKRDVTVLLQPLNYPERIEVNMLGEFSITMNGNTITNLKGRTKRVWMLIEYLLANRHKDISLDKLVEVLWEEDTCNDPLNALKNLVYRARAILKELSGSTRAEYIQFTRNTYAWNNSYSCTIDTEEMEAAWRAGGDATREDEERIDNYLRAIRLYRGEFLPKSCYSNWVITAAAYYASIYNECVLRVSDLLCDRRRYEDVIHICENALTHSPLEESIHKVLLYAYISSGQRNRAMEHYNYATNLFYRELGVDISESMRSLYRQLNNSINNIELDLGVIKNDLREACGIKGAFLCDYDVFKHIYRIQARSIMRTGQTIFVALLTISDRNGNLPEPDVLKISVERLRNAILNSLRKGDVVTTYSASQYIIMLPLVSYENAENIVDRIVRRFRFEYRKDNVRVTTKISMLDSVDLE